MEKSWELDHKERIRKLLALQAWQCELLEDCVSARRKVKYRSFIVLLKILKETKRYYKNIERVCEKFRCNTEQHRRISRVEVLPSYREQMEFLRILLESMESFEKECVPNWEKITEINQTNFKKREAKLKGVENDTVQSSMSLLKVKYKSRRQYTAKSVYEVLSKLEILLETSKFAEPLAVCNQKKYLRYKKYEIPKTQYNWSEEGYHYDPSIYDSCF